MKSYAVGVLDSEKRASQKQAGREQDRVRLQAGLIDRDELRRENGFYSSLPLRSFRIASVGGRPVGRVR